MTKKYAYVPAALDSSTRGFALGVKYRKPDAENKYKVTKVKNGIKVDLVDRQVYYMRASGKERLTALDFDEVLDLSFSTNPGLLTKMGYQFAMVNSHALPSKYYREHYAYEQTQAWPEIIADSGGFQLSRGVVSFLDPKDIIKAQNQICSIGISLDIPFPLTHASEVPLFQRAAHIQRRNNDVFKKYKRPDLKLMNVFHGPNFYLLDKYREVVEDDDIGLLSVGGVRRIDLTSFMLRLVYVITTGRKYKQYHALGVSGLERWLLLSYLSHKNVAKLITSDSSTYLQCGSCLQYFDPNRLCYTQDMQVVNAQVGQHKRLSCTCPVCSVLGYSAAMNDRANTMGFQACVFHNLFLAKNFIDEIYELSALPHKEIMRYLSKHTSTAKMQVIQSAMRAIDMALQDGPLKAAAKFGPSLLLKKPTSAISQKGIFKDVEITNEAVLKKRERLNVVLDKFDEYYGTKRKK